MLLPNDAWRTELETHLWKRNLRQKPFRLIWLNGASTIFKIKPPGTFAHRKVLQSTFFLISLLTCQIFIPSLSKIHSMLLKTGQICGRNEFEYVNFGQAEDAANIWNVNTINKKSKFSFYDFLKNIHQRRKEKGKS